MSPKKSNNDDAGSIDAVAEGRRKSVRRLLGTGGLVAGGHLASAAWVKPTVDTVLLPAHADTSPADPETPPEEVASFEDPCFVTLTCTGQQAYDIQVDGSVVPPTENVAVEIDIAFNESGSLSPFATTTTDENGAYQAIDNFTSPPSNISVQIRTTLPDFPEGGTAECSVDVDNSSDTGALYPGDGFYTGDSDDFCFNY